MEHSTRILDLEAELERVVAYLRKLPTHPETHRVACHAENVLIGKGREHLAYEGCSVTPAGVYVIAARWSGDAINIKTSNVDRLGRAVTQRHAENLYAGLKQGITFKMTPTHDRLIPLSIFTENSL